MCVSLKVTRLKLLILLSELSGSMLVEGELHEVSTGKSKKTIMSPWVLIYVTTGKTREEFLHFVQVPEIFKYLL